MNKSRQCGRRAAADGAKEAQYESLQFFGRAFHPAVERA